MKISEIKEILKASVIIGDEQLDKTVVLFDDSIYGC